MSRKWIPVWATLTCAMACAGAVHQRSSAPCSLLTRDSIYLRDGPVYPACAVDSRAQLIDEPSPAFDLNDASARGTRCLTVTLQFIVDTTGTPEPATLKLISTTNSAYADAIRRMVPAWRFQPARKNGVAVRQILQFEREVV